MVAGGTDTVAGGGPRCLFISVPQRCLQEEDGLAASTAGEFSISARVHLSII